MGVARGPTIVMLDEYCIRRASLRGIALHDAVAIVLEGHARRRRNRGSADWRVADRGIVVLYDWPCDGDVSTACIRTVWWR